MKWRRLELMIVDRPSFKLYDKIIATSDKSEYTLGLLAVGTGYQGARSTKYE